MCLIEFINKNSLSLFSFWIFLVKENAKRQTISKNKMIFCILLKVLHKLQNSQVFQDYFTYNSWL